MMPMKADLVIYSFICNWCVWITQECGFYIKPLFGFQFLWDLVWVFAQIQSHINGHLKHIG